MWWKKARIEWNRRKKIIIKVSLGSRYAMTSSAVRGPERRAVSGGIELLSNNMLCEFQFLKLSRIGCCNLGASAIRFQQLSSVTIRSSLMNDSWIIRYCCRDSWIVHPTKDKDSLKKLAESKSFSIKEVINITYERRLTSINISLTRYSSSVHDGSLSSKTIKRDASRVWKVFPSSYHFPRYSCR